MTRPVSENVIEKLKHAENLYHRLILVVGPEGKGKTSVLQELASRVNAPLVNINLELSRRLLDLTERQLRSSSSASSIRSSCSPKVTLSCSTTSRSSLKSR